MHAYSGCDGELAKDSISMEDYPDSEVEVFPTEDPNPDHYGGRTYDDDGYYYNYEYYDDEKTSSHSCRAGISRIVLFLSSLIPFVLNNFYITSGFSVSKTYISTRKIS